MRGVPTGRAVENKKFSWEFFFHPLYLHGGQPLSVGIFCAFCHNIKVFGVVIDGTFSAQRVVIRRIISGQKHCYRGHISGDFRCYQRHNFLQYVLLSTTQFPADFPTIAPSAVVIRRTFPPHNGAAQALLSTAQFPVLQGFFRIFSKVIELLSAAQFAVALAARPVLLSSALFAAWVVIRGTFSIL